MRKQSVLVLVTLLILGLVAGCFPPAAPAPDAPPAIRVTSPPNPNALPLLLALADPPADLTIEFVPAPGVPELAALVQGDQVDVALFFSAAGAKQYNQEALPQLRLWNVNVWRALYLVTDPDVQSFEDLLGKKILASFPGGAPDLVMRAAMRAAGYDPDADFVIEYLPSAQVQQLLLAGEGDAALLPQPQAGMVVQRGQQQDLALAPTIDLQAGFGAEAWPEGQAPLGGVFVTQATLDDPDRRAAFLRFVEVYDQAVTQLGSDPQAGAEAVSAGFSQHFGGQMPAQAIVNAIDGGFLSYASRPVGDLRPDLDRFLENVIGQAPDDGFYGQP